MVLITIVNGVYKPTYNWGAPPWLSPDVFSDLIRQEKKKLHNMVLELKGNIRVFVRVPWWLQNSVPGAGIP